MNFDGYLLVTDMDNTLLNSEHRVSEKNRRAVKYFTDNGGLFTVATGRTASAARDRITEAGALPLAINAPAILQNGAVLYDFQKNSAFYERHIADERKGAARIMHERYPFLGFEIYTTGDEVYVYSPCHLTNRLKKRSGTIIREMTDEVWTMPWTKLLMIAPKDILDKYIPVYRSLDPGYAVRSGDEFFDIVSDEASKGKALTLLAGRLGLDKSRVIAAGDNYNDVDLMTAAGISYAVENARDEIKEAADFTAPHCDDDAIAWIIGEIEAAADGAA